MRSILGIVDGNYFVNYASHAAVADLMGPNGEPTGALHVFLGSLWNIKHTLKGNIIVVFDGGRAAFRNKLYPDYKKRKEVVSPDGKYDPKVEQYMEREDMKKFTFKTLDTLLPAMGIPSIRVPNEEADDVVYILAKYLSDKHNIYCVTSDEDYVQMVQLGATVYLYKQDAYITQGNFKSVYSFEAEAFTLYKAMKGDGSDNIKGVPGVGEVTATKILGNLKEPSLLSLHEFCSSHNDKKHKSVIDNFPIIKRNLRLIDLKYIELSDDVVINAYEESVRAARMQVPLAKKILHEYGLSNAMTKWLPEMIKG